MISICVIHLAIHVKHNNKERQEGYVFCTVSESCMAWYAQGLWNDLKPIIFIETSAVASFIFYLLCCHSLYKELTLITLLFLS